MKSKIKLATWKNAPTVEELKHDFQAAESSHQMQEAKIAQWVANLQVENASDKGQVSSIRDAAYIGPDGKVTRQGQSTSNAARSKVQPKLIRKQAEWRYTSLSEPFLNTPDIFNIDPITPEDVAAAKQNALVLNNQFNTKLNKVAFIDSLVRAFVNEGTALVRTGWIYESEEVEVEYPVYSLLPTTDPAAIQELQMMSQTDPNELEPQMVQALQISMETGRPHYPMVTGYELVKEEKTIRNQPTVDVCDYANVRIDPSCNGKLEDAQFVIYSYESSLSDLTKAGKYTNLDKIVSTNVISDGRHESSWATSGFNFQDKSRQKLTVYEYWGWWDIDDNGRTKPFVASWVGDTLIQLEESPFDDIPFVAIPYMPVKDSVHGEADAEMLIDNQNVQGAVTRGMLDLFAKSANSQTGIRKGALDLVNKRKYERGQDYEFNDMGDAQQSIYQHSFPEIPASAFNMLTLQTQEAESLTGIQSFSQGITGVGLGSTAAAANGALSAAARRELGILRRLAEGVRKIGHKIVAMNQSFLSEEEVIRVTNGEFVEVRRDDLAGHFDLRISISTAEADEQKAQELSFMLQTTGQSFGLEFTKIILGEIADLRKMPHLAEQIRNFQPAPDPMAQQLQQMEIMLKQAEIQKMQAEIQLILSQVELNGGKAAGVRADSDKKNLDYMEQRSGVTHARNMQKDSAQATGNMRLKAFEHELNKKDKDLDGVPDAE